MDDRFDIPYVSNHPETELEKKFRQYNEADELYEKLVKDITSSKMEGLTKIICLYNIKTQWLERVLNDFYDRIAITSSQLNPIVYGDKISNKRAREFIKKGETVGFADLTLGRKHKALSIFHYKKNAEEIKYQKYLNVLADFVTERNDIIHNLFTQMKDTKAKTTHITESVLRLEVLIYATKQRDDELAKYLFEHMGEYWDLSIKGKKKQQT
jgi:ribosomal protein S18